MDHILIEIYIENLIYIDFFGELLKSDINRNEKYMKDFIRFNP